MSCDCCCEEARGVWLTPCLHSICGLCASDLATFTDPTCPRCHERICRDDLQAAEPTPSLAQDNIDDGTVDAPPPTAWYELECQAQSLRARAQNILADATDICNFARENLGKVTADIKDAYNTPAMRWPPFRARRRALAAEAETLLRADIKEAEGAMDYASTLLVACLECLAACNGAINVYEVSGAPPKGMFARLSARLGGLRDRVDKTLPPLASVPYFAAVRPLTAQTEPHAFIGRTLIWHARWAAHDHLQAHRRREITTFSPKAAMPDGRIVYRNNKAVVASEIHDLTSVSCGGRDDAILVPRVVGIFSIYERVQVDGTGRIWLSTAENLVCWASDGHLLQQATAQTLRQRWNVSLPAGTLFYRVNVAPCGLVIVRFEDVPRLYAATPDLSEIVWTAPCEYIVNLAFIGVDTLVCWHHRNVVSLIVDVHTGRRKDLQVDIDKANFECTRKFLEGRENALENICTPERLREAFPGVLPPESPHRVSRFCETMTPMCHGGPVLGAHGLVYRLWFEELDDGSIDCPRLRID